MGSATGNTPQAPTDLASVKPEDMPTAVRMRRLEQKTQALKERAWQLKARVQMLKEQMLGGGVGAQAMIAHASEMGSSFRLTSVAYTLDGTQIFARSDDAGDTLYKTTSFDVFNGPISPGNHTLTATVTYRGHGYGVFEYLSKFTFQAHGGTSFLAEEGKTSKVECRGYEKGNANTPMEQRPAVDCKVTQVAPQKAPEAPSQSTPGSTPLPAPAASTPATGK
ncbi:MAG: dihydrolipoamide acetyltransferase [Deltaproteobacteria bacterium]|nr:dihydrolipoamide acetyltransferase [Deltaproteobacteria bacterium]